MLFSRVRPPIENKIEQKIETLRWRLAKVAFDTVRFSDPRQNLIGYPYDLGTLQCPADWSTVRGAMITVLIRKNIIAVTGSLQFCN